MNRSILSTSSSGLDNLSIDHGIGLIRLRIHVNNVEFIDGKNIIPERLTELMNQEGTSAIYTTPAPTPEVRAQFLKLQQRGCKEIFVTTLSSQLSESYKIISEVATEFADNMDIYVYDCKELNICEAIMALEAAYLTEQGLSMPNIAARLNTLRAAHKMYFAIEDMSYLIKNNKVSNAAGFVANLFNIKPILGINDNGEVVPIRKIHRYSKALEYLLEKAEKVLKRNDTFVYLLSTGNTSVDTQFLKLLKDRLGVDNVPILPASSISIANQGPTGIGLCYFEGEVPYTTKNFLSNSA